MPYLDRAWDLVTSDPLFLLVAGTLAVALLAILAMSAWSPRHAPSASGRPAAGSRRPTERRSSEARKLVASGTELSEIARRTGLSRDALALVSGEHGATPATVAARQKGPGAARLSLPWRRGAAGHRDTTAAQLRA